jgi:hypothetical protein
MGEMRMSKVLEFKPRQEKQVEEKKDMEQIYFEEMATGYAEEKGIEDIDSVESVEEMMKRKREIEEMDRELVFNSHDDAVAMSSVLLDRPEYENVSHFKVEICLSRV